MRIRRIVSIAFVLTALACGGSAQGPQDEALAHAAQPITSFTYPMGITAATWYLPDPSKGDRRYMLDKRMSIEVEPPSNWGFYLAHQFSFVNGDIGYAGLQTNAYRPDGTMGKIALFSIWSAVGADATPGSTCSQFQEGGSGWSCRIAYNWVPGRVYRLRTGWSQGLNTDSWVNADLLDETTGISTRIGSLRVPSYWNGLGWMSVDFNEFFSGPSTSCSALPFVRTRTWATTINEVMHQVRETAQLSSTEEGDTYGSPACSTAFVTATSGAQHPTFLSEIGGTDVLHRRAFDAQFYLDVNPDLANAFGATNHAAARNHWVQFGVAEGRMASPAAFSKNYLARYADVRTTYGSNGYLGALRHWELFGLKEGRQGSHFFDPSFYLSQHADLRTALGATAHAAAMDHWLQFGLNEGRRGSFEFDPKYYLQANPDVAAVYGSTNYRGGLLHYIRLGQYEGRVTRP